jgi:hypothetical protein
VPERVLDQPLDDERDVARQEVGLDVGGRAHEDGAGSEVGLGHLERLLDAP